MSKSTLTQLETIAAKMYDGEFDLLVNDAPEGSRRVLALNVNLPTKMTILTQDGLDMGYGDDRNVDLAIKDFHISERDYTVGQDVQLTVTVELPRRVGGELYIVPETLEDLADTFNDLVAMRDDVNRCLLFSLWGTDPSKGFPGWDEVFAHLGEQGAHDLVERLKALKFQLEQEA